MCLLNQSKVLLLQNYISVYVVDSELFRPASREDENNSEVSADIQNSRAEFAAPGPRVGEYCR